MLEQKFKRLMNWLRVDRMIIVEDEDERSVEFGDLIQEVCQQYLEWWRLTRLEQSKCGIANARVRRIERRQDVHPKTRGVIVAFVERDPGDLKLALGNPC